MKALQLNADDKYHYQGHSSVNAVRGKTTAVHFNFFTEQEKETDTKERYERGEFTTQEYSDFCFINGTTSELDSFYHTGHIPTRMISRAMSAIDEAINKLVDRRIPY